MSEICCGCRNKIKWFHKKGGGKYPCNSSWHRNCAISNETGYSAHENFTHNVMRNFDLPDIHELYDLYQPQPQPEFIFNRKMEAFKLKYPKIANYILLTLQEVKMG